MVKENPTRWRYISSSHTIIFCSEICLSSFSPNIHILLILQLRFSKTDSCLGKMTRLFSFVNWDQKISTFSSKIKLYSTLFQKILLSFDKSLFCFNHMVDFNKSMYWCYCQNMRIFVFSPIPKKRL